MNVFATIVLLAWVPASAALFAILPPRRAVLAGYLVGWLFLPWAEWSLGGLPKVLTLTKLNAVTIGPMIGILIFDSGRLTRFRPRLVDLPMAVWCFSPFLTSLSNGLGVYDGVCEIIEQVMVWGFPYLAGRLYFTDARALRELAIAVFLGGLAYVPFCLFEIRMSPMVHKLVYGGQPGGWDGTRLGGWRPKVFMQDGLALGLWMSVTTLVGTWLWKTRSIKRIWSFRSGPLVAVLFITTIFCKSLGALIQLLLALGVLSASRTLRTALPVLLLAGIPLTYMTLRALELWSGESAVLLAAEVDEARAWSLEFRLLNENVLIEHALERPILGWGGWARSKAYSEDFKAMATQDGLWIIALGKYGLVGLAALTGVLLGPLFSWLRRAPARRWKRPELGAGTVLSVILLMFFIDSLLNAFLNPVLFLAAGAVPAARVARKRATRRSPAAKEAERPPGPVRVDALRPRSTIAAAADRSHPAGS